MTNEFKRLHDDAGELVAGFDSGDIALITEASQVSKYGNTIINGNDKGLPYLCEDPEDWITVRAWYFVDYIDSDGVAQSDWGYQTLDDVEVQRTSTGFILRGTLNKNDDTKYTFYYGTSYTITGPIYQVMLEEDEDNGGPVEDWTFPENPTAGDSQLPAFSVPLYVSTNDRDAYQYGTLQAYDVEGIQKSGSYEVGSGYEWVEEHLLYGEVAMTFECNYLRNTSQRVYYVQQMVDDDDRDGPESEVSDEITVPPGQYLKLWTPLSSGFSKNKLYRSAQSDSGFALLDDVDASTYIDDFREVLTDDLPPNGNVPFDDVDEAVKGALKHPAGYAVYFDGADLRPSSEWIDTERPWACPEDYAYTFDSDIQCLALSGGTILVFTEAKVYRAHGQHPGRLALYQISNKPILDKCSLWQIGNMVGWVNEEGLCVFDGSGESLLTGDYMRADEWQALSPSSFRARTNDRTVCLFGDTNLRFDLRGDRVDAISNFEETDGSEYFEWKSKLFRLPVASAWYAARLVADEYPVKIGFHADGRLVEEVLMLDDSDTLLPRMAKAKQWEFVIEGKHEVRSLVLATNRAEV